VSRWWFVVFALAIAAGVIGMAFNGVIVSAEGTRLPGTHTIYEDGSYTGCLPAAICND
jgi:hypothetical protein